MKYAVFRQDKEFKNHRILSTISYWPVHAEIGAVHFSALPQCQPCKTIEPKCLGPTTVKIEVSFYAGLTALVYFCKKLETGF